MSEHIRDQLAVMNQQAKELASIYHNAAGRCGISDNEYWVWYALLVLGGEYSQTDICNALSLPKQTVNSVISNLSKKGFVFLEPVPGTRNRKVIRLSQEGRTQGETIVAPVYQAEQQSLEKMSYQERETYISLLGKYIGFLKDALCDE